ncbi:MAG: hypothetical protein ACLQMH_09500 [Solirubrobacteraceae bacterium]
MIRKPVRLPRKHKTGAGHRRRTVTIILAALLVEAVALRLRGYRIGGNVVVRCRKGHLYTTIWVPGASVKSLRFGWWRFQHCPTGGHWSIVTPVKEADLTEQEKRIARATKDIRIP